MADASEVLARKIAEERHWRCLSAGRYYDEQKKRPAARFNEQV
jgi:hypothetical protein